jgi:hypothetical protein
MVAAGAEARPTNFIFFSGSQAPAWEPTFDAKLRFAKNFNE